jgi:hypothetical protein
MKYLVRMYSLSCCRGAHGEMRGRGFVDHYGAPTSTCTKISNMEERYELPCARQYTLQETQKRCEFMHYLCLPSPRPDNPSLFDASLLYLFLCAAFELYS